MIEKTVKAEDGIENLLCEKDRKSGAHITYPYGWKSDSIEPEALTKAVELVLTGKLEYGASSNFSGK